MNRFGELFAAGSSKNWNVLALFEGIDPLQKGRKYLYLRAYIIPSI